MKEKLNRNKIKTVANKLVYKVGFDRKTLGISVNGIHTTNWRNVRRMLPRRRAFSPKLIILVETDKRYYKTPPAVVAHLEMFKKGIFRHLINILGRRCQSCGCFFKKITFRRSNTAYVEDKLNYSYECEECFDHHEECWNEMWDEYNRGRV